MPYIIIYKLKKEKEQSREYFVDGYSIDDGILTLKLNELDPIKKKYDRLHIPVVDITWIGDKYIIPTDLILYVEKMKELK